MIAIYSPPGSLAVGRTLSLSPRERHHLHVRRAGDRTEIRVVDGAGTVGVAVLQLQGTEASVTLEQVRREPAPPSLVLAVGAGDKDRFAFVAEKAVELGATRLVPLETERSQAVATRMREKHLDRLRDRALEALKQCGGAWLTEVMPPVDLAGFLAGSLPPVRWLADGEGDDPPTLGPQDAAVIAVGPEGGFTPVEQEAFRRAGFRPVRLGPHQLRFETAAVAALTVAWTRRQGEPHD